MDNAENIGYALAKQVPAMERGFTIQTSYGELYICADDAPRVAQIVRSILQKQLKRAEATAQSECGHSRSRITEESSRGADERSH